ncbi:MAG: HAD hydrolase-like protein, partial [Oscillospiraceae bacterium]|nr:HAD hydrolase-like protein [Oscillospiraceae bacterium]
TSKPEPLAQEILEGFALMPYFDIVAGASWDRSRETKGEVLQYLLGCTGNAGEAVMIGDTHFDVIGAHELNLPAIGVTWGYGLEEEMVKAEAEAIVDSPEELAAYLLSAEES